MTESLSPSWPLADYPLTELLPHRAPMILIDGLLTHETDSLVTWVQIGPDSPFFDEALGGVPNYVAIEYMAQSIAALAGLEAKCRGEPIRVGFLLGSRKLALHAPLFKAGKTYQTKVTRLYQEDSGLAVFDCQILDADLLVASANVNVFQPQDTQAYVQGTLNGSGASTQHLAPSTQHPAPGTQQNING
jgi:predicted hotdog family 3-hydroxylacyl-ACP dehydratase